MRRSFSEFRIGDTQIRYRIRIEDEPSQPGQQANGRLTEFLRQMADGYELLACGIHRPQVMKITHNGQCWVLEAEATVDVT